MYLKHVKLNEVAQAIKGFIVIFENFVRHSSEFEYYKISY